MYFFVLLNFSREFYDIPYDQLTIHHRESDHICSNQFVPIMPRPLTISRKNLNVHNRQQECSGYCWVLCVKQFNLSWYFLVMEEAYIMPVNCHFLKKLIFIFVAKKFTNQYSLHFYYFLFWSQFLQLLKTKF